MQAQHFVLTLDLYFSRSVTKINDKCKSLLCHAFGQYIVGWMVVVKDAANKTDSTLLCSALWDKFIFTRPDIRSSLWRSVACDLGGTAHYVLAQRDDRSMFQMIIFTLVCFLFSSEHDLSTDSDITHSTGTTSSVIHVNKNGTFHTTNAK